MRNCVYSMDVAKVDGILVGLVLPLRQWHPLAIQLNKARGCWRQDG